MTFFSGPHRAPGFCDNGLPPDVAPQQHHRKPLRDVHYVPPRTAVFHVQPSSYWVVLAFAVGVAAVIHTLAVAIPVLMWVSPGAMLSSARWCLLTLPTTTLAFFMAFATVWSGVRWRRSRTKQWFANFESACRTFGLAYREVDCSNSTTRVAEVDGFPVVVDTTVGTSVVVGQRAPREPRWRRDSPTGDSLFDSRFSVTSPPDVPVEVPVETRQMLLSSTDRFSGRMRLEDGLFTCVDIGDSQAQTVAAVVAVGCELVRLGRHYPQMTLTTRTEA